MQVPASCGALSLRHEAPQRGALSSRPPRGRPASQRCAAPGSGSGTACCSWHSRAGLPAPLPSGTGGLVPAFPGGRPGGTRTGGPPGPWRAAVGPGGAPHPVRAALGPGLGGGSGAICVGSDIGSGRDTGSGSDIGSGSERQRECRCRPWPSPPEGPGSTRRPRGAGGDGLPMRAPTRCSQDAGNHCVLRPAQRHEWQHEPACRRPGGPLCPDHVADHLQLWQRERGLPLQPPAGQSPPAPRPQEVGREKRVPASLWEQDPDCPLPPMRHCHQLQPPPGHPPGHGHRRG
ncbi:alpha-N-acetylgalactosaminide alpha-2,6-sialyltransferase 6 isoform X4 [Aphelocoma coerulescens]|uniref:alpha-N-acetylgalactosaminide alpha-2,6-sialyltransferase 6 isoform X4 n=1 Tax=Aphelocoma coerulescens TaxID=39617 RepID=UPI003604FFE9